VVIRLVSLGLTDIFTALYFDILKHDPKNPDWDQKRHFDIKQWAYSTGLLCCDGARAGYFPVDELMTLRSLGSRLQGHPERVSFTRARNNQWVHWAVV